MRTTTRVTVRYFAAARAAAGTDTEQVTVPTGGSVADLLAVLHEQHGPELGRVLDRCSFLLDETAVRDRAAALTEGATLDVLPPFAGG